MADSEALPVRDLGPGDLARSLELSSAVGWNQVEADWRLFLELGHAVGVDDGAGRLLATAATLPAGPEVSWISMVIVRHDHRRQGIATALLLRCAEEIEAAGRTPGLDATPAGREVYRRLGFRDSWTLARWRRTGDTPVVATEPPGGVSVRGAGAEDLDAVAALERRAGGGDRTPLLRRLMARSAAFATLAEGPAGPCGFVLGREGRTATHLGPLVAESEEVAGFLVRHALERIATPAIIDAADGARRFTRFLEASGFGRERPFTRMYRGRLEPVGDLALRVAIAGPELG
jgi:GNAT superfamily N-acetyltransferase